MGDRKRGGEGKGVDRGGRRIIKKKKRSRERVAYKMVGVEYQ